MDGQLQQELAILVIIVILARIFYLVHKITTGFSRTATTKRTVPCKTVICLGSGGHTTEMLTLMAGMDLNKYSPRYYFVADSDKTSHSKVRDFENVKNVTTDYTIVNLPRSRVVGQSYVTSIFTTFYSLLYCIPLVVKIRPDLILCNGPGTCVPVCLVGFVLKAMLVRDTRTVFVESYCRTETFSLTGRILMYFADNFLVQWPSLKRRSKRAEYIGQLM